ncbi:growth-regulating factor 1-like isoform X1 [Salvia splendens]|uniref:growth-regulating factor 1-like isoform X1 n=1 Tax=Salvia splendens TaxID=180675 RepID=UPI001C26C79A|nr:growth-regulating factor 1-like isoform X1 [Salvia splendens]
MDFALLPSDTAFSLQNGDADKPKYCHGFGFLKQDRAINEDNLREFKMSKNSSCGEGSLQRSNGCGLSSAEMLSFSSPNPQPLTLPYYHYSSNAFARNAVGMNGGSMQHGVRGPFTPSQWMELEHQALIYKYITANVPIPSYLLNPIRKAFEVVGFSSLRSNPLGWNGFHLGYSSTDPEPGRCRRTDGKKWRCSRDAVVDQKYCERHMNRGRHRSRKPVEAQSAAASNATAKPTVARSIVENTTLLSKTKPKDSQRQDWERNEFGLVCSDSLVNPLNRSELRQFMDQPDRDADRTQLSISMASSPPRSGLSRELEMGLGLGNRPSSNNNWAPISWEPSAIGGPLGEVLHNTTTTTTSDAKQLNLIERWDSPRLDASPTGVLQRGAFASLSNSSAAGSPPHDVSTYPSLL